MKYEFPIKYFEENLIFNKHNECWACYQILGVSYDYLSKDKKIMLLNRVTRFVSNIGTEAQLLIIPVAQDVRAHQENLVKNLNREDPLYQAAAAHAKGTMHYLEEKIRDNGSTNDYNIYILTRLEKQKISGGNLEDLIKRPIKAINELFEVEQRDILESEIRSYREVAENYWQSQTRRIRMEPVSNETLQWLYRRMTHRGVSDGAVKLRTNADGSMWKPAATPILKDGEKAIRPLQTDILTLSESLINPKCHRYITCENTDGTISYQTFLSISSIPDGMVFPGGEWLLLLQDYPYATEVCLHITTIEHRESIKKIGGKQQEIESQQEHVAQSAKIPAELRAAASEASQLEAELRRTRDPLCRVSVTFCIASDDKDMMEAHAKFVRERYEDKQFIVERPMTDQFKLFMECIPGAGRYMNDYIIPLPPRTVAGSMFAVTRLLGDNLGPYIGTTGVLDKLVFLDLALACRRNNSASAFFCGTLGGGKSFNANLLAYLNVLYAGARVLIIDPKGDRDRWAACLPYLADQISLITLSPDDKDQGSLDPFIIYRDDLNQASELATNILCEYFGITSKDLEYTAILAAIDQIRKTAGKPCMNMLAEILANFPDEDELKPVARNLARKIQLLRNAGMAKLLFGYGDEDGLRFTKKINILQIQNMTMPSAETPKQDYTQEERLSTVLMLPIASFCMKFAAANRNEFDIVVFDESWALNTTQMGKKLTNSLARMGRSLYASAIFIGHSVSDVDSPGLKEAITYKFCFKSNTQEEIIKVLKFLNLEATDENIELVSNLPNRTCLFQDLENHVGILRFDAIWQDIIDAFNTTPGEQKQKEK